MNKKITFFYDFYNYNNLENFLTNGWQFHNKEEEIYPSSLNIRNSKWFYLYGKNSLMMIMGYSNKIYKLI